MNDAIKLTIRQKIFLIRLVEVFSKTRQPVHHIAFAKVLGLSKSTTYDMLKLLESKGWICSIYAVADAPRKQGRSKIMFLPTEWSIEEVFRPLGGEDAEGEQTKEFLIRFLEKQRKNEFNKFYEGSSRDLRDLLSAASRDEPSLAPRDGLQQDELDELEELKSHIITTIGKQTKVGYARLIRELSVLMEETSSPLARCAEVILAVLLYIRAAKYKLDSLNPLQMLLEAPVTKERMSMFVGLVWGLVLSNPKTRRLAVDLDRSIEDYEESISKLSQEELAKLHDFTKEIWGYLSSSTGSVK
jgi:DNA-binding Lrp family transcriptional regulator